jgi:hypothetical protein
MINRLETIKKIVCEGEILEPEQLHVKTRKGKIKEARQICLYFGKYYKCGTYKDISAYFGQNHASVNHADKTINNLMDSDKHLKYKIELYRAKLNKEFGIGIASVLDIKIELQKSLVQEQILLTTRIELLKNYALALEYE